MATIQQLQEDLRRSEDREAATSRRLVSLEDSLDEGARCAAAKNTKLGEELRQARQESSNLEDQRLALEKELSGVRSELKEERTALEAKRLADLQLERHFHEDAQVLQEEVRASKAKAAEFEVQAEARTRQVVQEHEHRAARREEELLHRLAERERYCERQVAMAEDQEKTIQRLEQRLKEQDDQVRRERREIQNKASTSKTRASLLEEQVSCLKEQLMREQSELRASERAW